ncbi:MAG: beta-propeller fold lactonase family protein [Mesorhizobium sp.]
MFSTNSGNNNLSVFNVNQGTGALNSGTVPGAPFNVGANPRGVTVHPSGNFVYVANNNGSNISAFTLNLTNGVLSQIAGSPFAAGTNPETIITDAKGKYLYVSNSGSNSIAGYSIDAATGALTTLPSSPYATASAPTGLTLGGVPQ